MADLVTPGEVDAEIDNTSAGHAWANAGTGGWIVDGSDIADIYSALDSSALDGFSLDGSSGTDVTISAGEAYIAGWLCRDEATTVSLPDDSETTVYVGYDASAILGDEEAPAESENVIVGPESDFSDEDPRVPLYTFETSGGSVSDDEDHRLLEKPLQVDHEDGGHVYLPTGLRTGSRITAESVVEIFGSSFRQYSEDDGSGNEALTEFTGDEYVIGRLGGSGYTNITLRLGRSSDDGGVTTELAFGDIVIPNGTLSLEDTLSVEVSLSDTPAAELVALSSAQDTEVLVTSGDEDDRVRHMANGDLRADGDLYANEDDGVARITDEWDGSSMSMETPAGNEIEFIAED